MMLVDSHCHLDSHDFDADRDAVIERALEAGVSRMVAIGTGEGPPDLEAGVRMADLHPAVYATVGVHPNDVAKVDDETLRRVREIAKHSKVIALGEIGLDHHYDSAPRDRQRAIFIEQLSIAREAGLPVVIHTRDAWDETLEVLERHWAARGGPGIMHCFTGGPEQARRCLTMGLYLSFGGILTFPKAADVQQAAREAPEDRVLVETDAPYLAPVPFRGKRNEPSYVSHTAARLAHLRGTDREGIAAATTANFERAFAPRLGGGLRR